MIMGTVVVYISKQILYFVEHSFPQVGFVGFVRNQVQRGDDALKNAGASLFSHGENDVVCLAFFESDFEIGDDGAEKPIGFECGVFVSLGGIPHAVATVVHTVDIVVFPIAVAEIVTVADVEPVGSPIVVKAATSFKIIEIQGEKGMNVAQNVACGMNHNPLINIGDAHVGEGVVEAFHQNPDGVLRAVAHNVYVGNIRVGRSVIGTEFDVNADFCV